MCVQFNSRMCFTINTHFNEDFAFFYYNDNKNKTYRSWSYLLKNISDLKVKKATKETIYTHTFYINLHFIIIIWVRNL